MPPLAFLALVAAIAALVLIPTRRLFLSGWPTRSLVVYFVGLVGLGLVVAELRAPARFLIPILVVAYIAPFVTARAGFARLIGRSRGGPVAPIVTRPEIRSLPDSSEVVEPLDGAAEGGAPRVGESEPPEVAGAGRSADPDPDAEARHE